MPLTILILGGDGYLGWPLALKLSVRHPDAQIILVDNLARRRWVEAQGSQSLTPILSPEARLLAWQAHVQRSQLRFIHLDVATPALDTLIEQQRPQVIYHLAQQCSAPFSMTSVDQAVETVVNNEVSNLRLLWAMRAWVPDAHLIKLGSFGEYAKVGLDIPEGYFLPRVHKKWASRPAPFPREADDIYHVSKINDTNFISMACRKWGLRITDIMQSTIVGVEIAETQGMPDLLTRLDVDAVFGTVANRFIAQTLCHHPMTVYGSGLQRTGLMALEDAVRSLSELADDPAEPAEHRVINHVTVRDLCINEVAEVVASSARAHGLEPTIARGRFDPRQETPGEKADYHIETHYLHQGFTPTPLETVLQQTFETAWCYRDRIRPELFAPKIAWSTRP